jgi:Tat protein translocase TatB subunit
MPQVGPLEILMILVVALLVFGPKELPRLARQAAKGWREIQRFQASMKRDFDEVLRDDEDDDRPSNTPTLPPKAPSPELPAGESPVPPRESSPPADTSQ